MPARLIINADDFGLTAGVNRSISELHRSVALTSASLMANGPAFADAVATACANPALRVGCHLVFTDGTPTCTSDRISSLVVAGTRRFRPTFSSFIRSASLNLIAEDDLVREGSAQVARLQAAGIAVTHLDTHKHTHMLPVVARALLRIAHHCKVNAIRNPFEPPWATALGYGGILRRASISILRASFLSSFQRLMEKNPAIHTTDGTIGIAATGAVTSSSLGAILSALPPFGTWEFVVHPGYDDVDLLAIPTRLRASREIEHSSLLRLRSTITLEIDLLHYGDL